MNRELSSTRAVSFIARREFVTRVRSKATLISSAVMVVAVVALIVIRSITSGGDETLKIAMVEPTKAAQTQLEGAARGVGERVDVRSVTSVEQGRSQLRDGDIDALVTDSEAAAAGQVDYTVKKSTPEGVGVVMDAFARGAATDAALSGAGVDRAELEASIAQADATVDRLEQTVANTGERYAIGFVATLLIYIALLMYGSIVAQGVVEEKSNRIVELLLTAVRPWQLMLGKVIGIGALGLVQLLATAAAGVAAALATDVLDMPSGVLVGAVAWSLVWFVVGYATFALVFASLGALVSRQEDVGSVTAPATTLLVVPYILALTAAPGTEPSRAIEWLSMAPLFSPVMMPMRIAADAPAWQPWLALGLALAALVALTAIAGRIYSNAVLKTGARVKIGEALRGRKRHASAA